MRVVVTGANGHLGSTLCHTLNEQGFQVKALVRRPHDDARIAHLMNAGLPILDFRLSDTQGLTTLFTGSDVVFHCAAPTAMWAKDPRFLSEPIYEGTLNVIRAASEAGVKRVIYTSSCSAVGFHAKEQALDEHNYNDDTLDPQFRAKVQAEKEGALLAKRLGVRLVRLCPPSLLGPGFVQATPSVEPYVQLCKGALKAVPNFSYPLLDVRDFAKAQVFAATAPEVDERYIVSGTFITTPFLLETLARIDASLALPSHILPGWSLPLLARLDAAAYYLRRGKSPRRLPLTLARECKDANQNVSDIRFRTHFPTFQTRPLDETIADTLSWIREYYLPAQGFMNNNVH